jgi:hypothetical protein
MERDFQCLLLRFCCLLWLLTAFAAAQGNPPQAPGKAPGAVGKYVGPGGCAASSCHGSVQPRKETKINQNEYSIWVVQDRHAKAFSVLSNPVSVRIARILKLPQRADQTPRCLACHSLNPAPEMRAQTFDLGDGVSCENCHGPASGWLGPHTTKTWRYEQGLQLGMYDTKNLLKRTEKCLECHLGTADKFVDHELIAAGHPDLTFELDSFSAVMPRHWKLDKQKNPWLDVQTWSVGQATQLRLGLDRLARRAKGEIWPEYAELDCFACHHSLTKPEDSWRQEVGYPNRRAGNVPWNDSRWAVFRHLAMEADSQGQQLDNDITRLANLVSQLNPNRDEIASLASRSSGVAERLAQQLNQRGYDQALAIKLLKQISGDGQRISVAGERTAEQAAMALDSLYLAASSSGSIPNQQEIKAAINGLFQLLENPSAYNAPRFAAQMKKVNGLLR